MTTKWENITTALEPFQVEPNLDPETQYLIPRMETSELDSVISELTEQIEEMEVHDTFTLILQNCWIIG